MRAQVPLSSDARADDETDGRVHEVLGDLATRRLIIANVAWIGRAASSAWVLVDAGVPGTPENGKYVADPALPEDGTAYRKPGTAKE